MIKRRFIAAILFAISHIAVANVCVSQQPSTSPSTTPEKLDEAAKVQFDLDKFVPFGVDPESVKPGAVMKFSLPEPPPGQPYPDVGMATQPAYIPEPQVRQNAVPYSGQPMGSENPVPNSPPTFNEAAMWQFSFYRAPWETVIRNFAQQNGFSLIINTLPPGEFNYFDQRSYTLQEAIDIMNDHLIPLGFLMVRNQTKLTVLARQNGIYEGIAPFIGMREVSLLSRNELATVAFPIKSQSQQTIIAEMQQLLSPMGSARVLTNSNRLIVTDTGAYLARVRDLLGGYGLASGEQDTLVIQLRNTKAESIAATLNQRLVEANPVRTASTDASSAGGPISAIVETNCLVLSGNNDELARLQSLIAEIDRAPAQVVIQGLLVEVNLGNTNEMGAELGLQDSVLFDRSVVDNLVTLSQTATAPNGVQTTNQNIISQTAAPGFAFNNTALGNNVAVRPDTIGSQGLSSLGVGRVNGELGFGGMVLSASSNSVNILLRALAAKYKTDILSRPQIRTIDNSEALIQIGQQVPVVDGVTVTAVGNANPIIRQDRAGIILRVTPRTSPDGLIQIRVEAEKSAFRLAPGSGVPVFADAKTGSIIQAPIKDLTTAQTTVSARAGQTIVLGGMITTEDKDIHHKVPFLGDIPLLGRLFRYDKTSSARKELLIFLTPHIVLCDSDSEIQKTIEMQRVQVNMARATQMHGPLLDQNRFANTEGMQIVPGSEFIVPRSIEINNAQVVNGQVVSPMQNTPAQIPANQNSPIR